MADETTPNTSDGDGKNTGNGGQQSSGTASEQVKNDERLFTQAEVDAMIARRLKRERGDSNARRSGLAEKPDQEQETFNAQLETLRRENREFRAERELIRVATETGAIDPDVIAKLAKEHLEFDADGKPVNVELAVKQVKAAHSKLFQNGQGQKKAPASINAGTTGQGTAHPFNMNDWIRSRANG